jgi:truncated hemoglobin YjbI
MFILLKKTITWLSVLLLLTACSTKMSYYFLDWAIEWEVEEYVTLNKPQQKQFDGMLEKFLIWHRQVELPKYSSQLNELLTQLQQGTLTPSQWVTQVQQAKAHWFRIFHYLLPDLIPLIASLSDEQVKGIMKQLRKEERELSDEYAGKTNAQLLDESNERLFEQADDWLGSVTQEQKALIETRNSQRLATLDMWLEYRHEWLRQFEQALNQRENAHLLTMRLTKLMTQPDDLKSASYQQNIDQNAENFGSLIVELSHTLNDKQRKRFNKKLNSLIVDLNELSLD